MALEIDTYHYLHLNEGASNNNIHLGLRSDYGQTPRVEFFNYIYNTYGTKVTLHLKQWTSLRYKLAESNARRNFLLHCRSNDVFPTNINNCIKRFSNTSFASKSCLFEYQRFIDVIKKRTLKLELKDIHIHISFLLKRLNRLKFVILNYKINVEIVNRFFFFTEEKCKKIFNNLERNLNKKFLKLIYIKNKLKKRLVVPKEKWVKNLTDTEIPEDILDVMSLGRNFNCVTNLSRKDIVNSIKNIEFSLDTTTLNSDTKNMIRESLVNNINFNFKNKQHISCEEKEFSKRLNNTKKFLHNNQHLFFTQADKGNVTVCMLVKDYKEKMAELLSDTNTYKIINKNPLKRLQKNVSELLKHLNEEELLPYKLVKSQLTLTDTCLAKAYGLPKIHKINVPLRPIISTINSPTHFLAKILYKDLINNIEKPKSHLNNSFDLIEKLKNIYIPDDYIFLSLDVTSLFTNIPCELVIESIDRRLTQIHNNCKIPFGEIVHIIKFLFDNNYFSFNNVIYQQIFGTPMGSPISPLFADIVMEDLEVSCLKKLEIEHNCVPLFYFRYVDDTIMCVNKKHIDIICKVFNGYNDCLKFTHEMEINNEINFLDLTLIKENNHIISNWYQKSISSGKLLNFFSNHTIQQKKNIVYNLIDRAILLSHKKFHKCNLKKVRNLLFANNYDESFSNKCINDRLRKIKFINTKINKQNNKYISTISLPYVQPFFHKSKKLLNSVGIRTLPLYNNTLKNDFIKLGKDKLNKFENTNVVYEIKCKDCSAIYIGQTKRMLKDRIKEHEKCYKEDSVISLHIKNNKHHFDWKNVKILDKECHLKKRLISEMLHINCNDFTLNKIEDTFDLNNVYRKVKI